MSIYTPADFPGLPPEIVKIRIAAADEAYLTRFDESPSRPPRPRHEKRDRSTKPKVSFSQSPTNQRILAKYGVRNPNMLQRSESQ